MMNEKRKALIVASVPGFITSFELNDISILQQYGYEIHIACNLITDELGEKCIDKLKETGAFLHHIDIQRSPFTPKTLTAYKELKKLINAEYFSLIHCHTPNASVLTRLAARKARKSGTKVFYTAHGFHFYNGAPLKNWLIYYPIEKELSRITDVLITINKEDYNRAKDKFHAKKVKYMPGVGIDTEMFAMCDIDKEKKRKELRIPQNAIVILSVGELNTNKNHEAVIKALSKINNTNIYYLIAGTGNLKNYLLGMSREFGMEDRVKLLGFRNDVLELLHVADIYVLPSIREGLNVSLMEAMSSGLPCLVSEIRGNVDLIKEGKGGYFFNPKEVDTLTNVLNKMIKDKNLRNAFGKYNTTTIKYFDKSIVINKMREIYTLI